MSTEAKILDFFQCFAPQDSSRASVAISLGLGAQETLSTLASKYRIPQSAVTARAALLDRVVAQLQRQHGVPTSQAPLTAVRFLRTLTSVSSPLGAQEIAVVFRQLDDWMAHQTHSTQIDLSPDRAGELPRPDERPPRPMPSPTVLAYAASPSSAGPMSSQATPLPTPTGDPSSKPMSSQSSILNDAANAARQVATSAATVLQAQGSAISLTPMEENSLRDYHRKLMEIEAKLFQRCLELQLCSEDVESREMALRTAEGQLQAEKDEFRIASEEQRARQNQREVELAEVAARQQTESGHLETLRQRLHEQQRQLDAAQRSLEERETKLSASTQSVAGREAALASQARLLEQERQLCQRLSVEVLKREGSVRAVEKQLAAAKAELVRLEDELGSRAKQVVADEAATRRWASELEKRELTVQSLLEQLRHKGIHVSYAS